MTDLSPEEERSRALEPNVAPGSGLGAGDQSALALPTSTTNISRRSSRSEESRSNSPSIDSLLEEGSYTGINKPTTCVRPIFASTPSGDRSIKVARSQI